LKLGAERLSSLPTGGRTEITYNLWFFDWFDVHKTTPKPALISTNVEARSALFAITNSTSTWDTP
jgi:hypothetical protein